MHFPEQREYPFREIGKSVHVQNGMAVHIRTQSVSVFVSNVAVNFKLRVSFFPACCRG